MFAGGGDETDSRPLDEIFAGWLGAGRLLYLPTALVHPSNKQAGCRWIQRAFEPLGVKNIEAWLDLPGKTARDLDAFDGVYIGGGNTFYLLQQLRQHQLDRALEDFIESGRPVYGGSAGAIVLGYDISSCAHIDENIIGLTDFSGMDQALGCTIWCHYQPNDRERIQRYVARTGAPSFGLSERAGLFRDGNNLYAAGYEPVVYFSMQGVEEIAPGRRAL